MLRFLTAGESHGMALAVIVEGLPAGLPLTAAEIQQELARRRLGFGRGPRMRFEVDKVAILAGIRHARTLGSPLAVEIANTEWPKWSVEMSAEPGATSKPLTKPRPGHADLAGMQKYGFDDARNVLERASARETAARVVAGCAAKALLAQLGIGVISHVVAIGDEAAPGSSRPLLDDLPAVDESPVRCLDAGASQRMVSCIKSAAKEGDSLGGVAEVLAYGVPPGLGSYVHWDRRLDALVAQALMSIQAVKAVEIGDGVSSAGLRGSAAHDAIAWDAVSREFHRRTDHAGGIEGGVSTGGLISARAFMKPLATLNRPVLETVDTETKEPALSFKERTDVTAVPAMGVVAESMLALVLASEALRKFGGDSVAELTANHRSFLQRLRGPSNGPVVERDSGEQPPGIKAV